MHFFKLFVAALMPLTTVFAVSAANPRSNEASAAGLHLSPMDRAVLDSLLNMKRSGMADAVSADTNNMLSARQSTDISSELDQLLSIISELGQFLTADFLNDTYSVVVNLAALLADPFVSDTRGIITQASGLLTDLEPLLDTVTSINITGIVDAVSPLLTTSSVNGIATLLTNAENLLTANFVTEVTTVINDVAPVSPLAWS